MSLSVELSREGAILLGAVQGITELLPISSSGHLVLFEHWLGLKGISRLMQDFDILLHSATALVLFLFYARTWLDILHGCLRRERQATMMMGLLVLATIPGAIAGLLLEDFIGNNLRSVQSVAIGLVVTGIFLLLTLLARGQQTYKKLKWGQALLIGISQALAIIPGFSRSGWTIATGQFMGLKRIEALDFSFMMALPIIVGATIVSAIGVDTSTISADIALAGFMSSLLFSAISLVTLRWIVRRISLAWFAIYLVPIGLWLLISGA